MGTFNRRPVHKGRMMKALTTFLLVGLVTMLWSASVTGDQSTLKEVLGFDENYCRGKSDGIFCKTNEPFPWSRRNRFKNANNEYEDGQCCHSLCQPLSSSGCLVHDDNVKRCQGKPDSEACNFYELGYDRRYHVIHGKCCLDAILQSPTCIRASDKC